MEDLFIPQTAEELELAVESGAVAETAYLDFKAYPERTDSTRKGIAKDIAAMSVYGGVVILGVAEPENKGGRHRVVPAPTAGWREWVSQIGLNAVQPAVRVTTRALERADGSGYVVVVIPASARAPHMADNRYWGRADTTNTPLSDIQVRRLWQRNFDRRDDAFAMLSAEVAREPAAVEIRTSARLFVVAQPVSADRRLLLDATEERDVRAWVNWLVSQPVLKKQPGYSPGIHSTHQLSRRAHGAGRSTYEVGPDRAVRDNGSHPASVKGLVDLEIREDGGLRLYYGRASDWLREVQYLLTTAIVGEVSTCIELARVISSTAGFYGSWTFGVGLVGLKSVTAYDGTVTLSGGSSRPYSEDTYEEVAEATWQELQQPGSPVLDALVGRFCRALHSGDHASVVSRDVFPIAEPAVA